MSWKIIIIEKGRDDEDGKFFASYDGDDTCLGVGDSEKDAVNELFTNYESLEKTIREHESHIKCDFCGYIPKSGKTHKILDPNGDSFCWKRYQQYEKEMGHRPTEDVDIGHDYIRSNEYAEDRCKYCDRTPFWWVCDDCDGNIDDTLRKSFQSYINATLGRDPKSPFEASGIKYKCKCGSVRIFNRFTRSKTLSSNGVGDGCNSCRNWLGGKNRKRKTVKKRLSEWVPFTNKTLG